MQPYESITNKLQDVLAKLSEKSGNYFSPAAFPMRVEKLGDGKLDIDIGYHRIFGEPLRAARRKDTAELQHILKSLATDGSVEVLENWSTMAPNIIGDLSSVRALVDKAYETVCGSVRRR